MASLSLLFIFVFTALIMAVVALAIWTPVRLRYRLAGVSLAALALGYGAYTAGWQDDDYCSVTIDGDEGHTRVVAGDGEVTLDGVAWPYEAITFEVQVGGWTGSSSLPLAGHGADDFTYVQTHYGGDGVNRITIGDTHVWLVREGGELRVREQRPGESGR